MEDFFSAELKDDPNGNQSGSLIILQKNYSDIMKNIQKKIDLEQTRIENWERTQKLAYARLDTLLAQYQSHQESVSAAIAQLPGA